MTRVMTGRTALSHASEAIARVAAGNTGGMDLVRLPSNGGIRRGEMQYVGTGVRTGKWSIREANRRR